MQNLMVVFTFSVLDQKNPFWANLVQKFKFVQNIWYKDYFQYAEFSGGVNFMCFKLEIPFLGKFGEKNQNCQFKLKIGI